MVAEKRKLKPSCKKEGNRSRNSDLKGNEQIRKVELGKRLDINTADLDGGIELKETGLLKEYMFGDNAKLSDLRLVEHHSLLRPWLCVSVIKQTPNDVVESFRVHASLRHPTNLTNLNLDRSSVSFNLF